MPGPATESFLSQVTSLPSLGLCFLIQFAAMVSANEAPPGPDPVAPCWRHLLTAPPRPLGWSVGLTVGSLGASGWPSPRGGRIEARRTNSALPPGPSPPRVSGPAGAVFQVEKLRHKQPCGQRSGQKCIQPSSLLSQPFSVQTNLFPVPRAAEDRGVLT